MRKNLSLLLFAIVAGTSMILAENNKIVKIDGLYYNLDKQNQTAEVLGMRGSSINVQDKSIAEWNLLPAEFVFETKLPQNANYQGLKSVKVYGDKIYINLLVEPDPDVIVDLEWVPFQVYINTDNSDATGGYSDLFKDPNADILLEGAVFGNAEASSFAEAAIPWAPGVFKWWGEVGGSGWEWVDPNVEHSADDCWGAIVCEGQLEDCTSQFVDGKIEIKINRTKIPATWNDSEFGIGFDIQQEWSPVGVLPQVSSTDENPRGLAHKLQVKIDNNSYADGETVNNLVVPATVTDEDVTYNVTRIGSEAFYGCTGIKSVTLSNSLTEIGDLAFADCQSLASIVIPNNVRTIGESAFINCNLEDIVFGSNLKIIETAAFMYNGTLDDDDPSDFTCSIKSITCYSMRPPTVRENTFYGMPYTTLVYVPADYLTYYQVHDIWGLYDVRPLGATSEETDKVDVETSTTSAEVVWPAVEGAETYELVIKDKQGNVICTLIFNANGQLTSIVFSAPARDNATEQTQYTGFAFTVTGLESGTTYDLTITAKDSNDQILQTTSQTFTTAELTGVEDIATNIAPTKVLRNGQLFILRGDKTYTVQGQEVR